MQEKFKSGETCKETGKYIEHGRFGFVVKRDIDIPAGNTFPPTKAENGYFVKQD